MTSNVAHMVCVDEELLEQQEELPKRMAEGASPRRCAGLPGSSGLWAAIAGVSTIALAGTHYSKASLAAVGVDPQSFDSKADVAALQNLQEVEALSGADSSPEKVPVLLGPGCCRPFDKLFEQTELGDGYTRAACEDHCQSEDECDAFAISGCLDGPDGSCEGMCHTYHLMDDSTWVVANCIDPALDGNTYCYYLEEPEAVVASEPDKEDRDACLPDLWWVQDFESMVILFPWWFDASKMPSGDLAKECPHVFGSSWVTLNKPLASVSNPDRTFTQAQIVPHSVEPAGNPTAGKLPLPADEASACKENWVYTDFPVLEGKSFCDGEYMKLPTHCHPCS